MVTASWLALVAMAMGMAMTKTMAAQIDWQQKLWEKIPDS